MERLSENSNAQTFAIQDSGSTGSTWLTRWLSGKKKVSIIGVVLTIILFFVVWLMVIQNDLTELKNETKHLQEMRKMTFVQDCKHLRYHGVTRSGKYFIDPDGQSEDKTLWAVYTNQFYTQTKPPLQVFCNFEKNYTVIPYHEQDVTQMSKLISESRGSCWQDLTFDCNALTYSLNGIPKAWWLDRNGASQYFFDGAFENTTKVNCQNCKCVGNYGRIRSDWLLPITGFEYDHDQPGLGDIVIGDLTCSDDLDLQITGKVTTNREKKLFDWKGTFQIRFEFEAHSVTNLTRNITKEKYYGDRYNSDVIIVNCQGFLMIEDFNIEYCSCSPNHNCRLSDVGYLKFTTNFDGVDRASVQFPSFGLNETQPVEVMLDHTGVIKIEVNSQIKHLVDNRIDKRLYIQSIKPSNINAFATIMNVRITE